MVGGDKDADSKGDCQFSGNRKTFWRSASWSASSIPPTPIPFDDGMSQAALSAAENNKAGFRGIPVPLTPRSQKNCKARASLPPLQPLSISRRSVDQWPKAGSDDLGEWPHPPTPGAKRFLPLPVDRTDMELDLDPVDRNLKPREFQLKRDKIAFFDKECSRIAEHIYLGSDAVAKNREILRQNGITHVLNCVGFVCPEYFKTDLVYKTLWLQDSPSEDITSILYDVFDYFEDVREHGGRVLVHCCQGVSRSTSLVIAYLMWRDGQSFEDAFQYVKAARGITNPNMGFACQLLQCQKRVHAAPVSPSSTLRMYRMAPHSPYDPLHLVPKILNHPGALALDSRGAFLVHIPSAIYVWIGKACEAVMSKDAKAAAFQVVRYERAEGPIVTIEEGQEPMEFWGALSSGPLIVDDFAKTGKLGEGEGFIEGWGGGKDQVASTVKLGIGEKKVDSYDVDFEIFQRAITGGVVPPFPLSGAGPETRLPARENGWGRLRRKFVSGSVKEFVTAARLTPNKVHSKDAKSMDIDACKEDERIVSSDSLLLSSPPYPSPGSVSFDSNAGLKSSLKSPSPSPSNSSMWSALSPYSSNWSDSSFLSSESSSPVSSFLEPFAAKCPSQVTLKTASSPSKGSLVSLAQRRGSVSPCLKLLSLVESPSQVSKNRVRAWSMSEMDTLVNSGCHEFKSENFDESSREDQLLSDAGLLASHEDMENIGLVNDYQVMNFVEGHQPLIWNDKTLNLTHPILYRWPNMQRVETLGVGVLDSTSVFLLLAQTTVPTKHILYVWVGHDVGLQNGQSCLVSSSGTDECGNIYWEKVGHNFLTQMGLPSNIPVQAIREASEPEEFLNHIYFISSHQAKESCPG